MSAALVVKGVFGLTAEVVRLTGSTARATVIPPVDLPYLRGHLPGLPTVPGMAIVDLIPRLAEAADLCKPPARDLVLARFHSPLMPGERLHLELGFIEGSSQLRAHGIIEEQRDLGEIVWSYGGADV